MAALVCALVFGILATWLGPKMIAYWYAPPVPAGAASAFNCTDAVEWAMRKLVWTQIFGSIGGAVIGVVIGALLARRKPAAAPPPPAKA
jgi:membrane associated rhomboid family serine protease